MNRLSYLMSHVQGINQLTLFKLTGISRVTIGKYLKGGDDLGATAIQFARFFSCSCEFINGYAEDWIQVYVEGIATPMRLPFEDYARICVDCKQDIRRTGPTIAVRSSSDVEDFREWRVVRTLPQSKLANISYKSRLKWIVERMSEEQCKAEYLILK